MAKDPICGMEVDEKKAKFKLVKDGKKYFFCSKNCYNKFLENKKETISGKTLKKKPIKNLKKIKESEKIKKTILPIKGMHCASCAVTIEKSLKKVSGVKNANVNFASEKASVEFDSTKTNESYLEKAVKDAGYEVIKSYGKEGRITLRVRGMSSQHCAGIVQSSLMKLDGIKIAFGIAGCSKGTVVRTCKDLEAFGQSAHLVAMRHPCL